MTQITSSISTGAESFQANRRDMTALIDRVRALEARTRAASARSKPRFEKRHQLLPRERSHDPGGRGRVPGPLRRDAALRWHHLPCI